MAAGMRGDPADAVARVGRHWGWVLAFGIITLVIGIVALVWPGRTLLVVAVLFGIQLIVMGIFRFVAAFASDDSSGGSRALLALLGVLSLIIGLYAARHVLVTLLALALILGIFWIVSGAVELFTALSHRQRTHRGCYAVMGIVSVLARDRGPGLPRDFAAGARGRARHLADRFRRDADHGRVPDPVIRPRLTKTTSQQASTTGGRPGWPTRPPHIWPPGCHQSTGLSMA
jgi:uncharacterized membrane protein HdeD (DUF308 family)